MSKKDAFETKKRKHRNEEAEIQSEFFSRIKLFFPHIPDKLIFAVPNGGSRNKIEAANLKRQGVKSGVADVIILFANRGFYFLCLEFKTRQGKQSDEQKEFQKQVESTNGKYTIVRSVKEALDVFKWYIE